MHSPTHQTTISMGSQPLNFTTHLQRLITSIPNYATSSLSKYAFHHRTFVIDAIPIEEQHEQIATFIPLSIPFNLNCIRILQTEPFQLFHWKLICTALSQCQTLLPTVILWQFLLVHNMTNAMVSMRFDFHNQIVLSSGIRLDRNVDSHLK